MPKTRLLPLLAAWPVLCPPVQAATAEPTARTLTIRASADPAVAADISALNKITVTQAEMLRYGDASIGDTLRRAAGIQTGSGGVRSSRFRGGSAPPAFLINGEPVQGGRRGGQTVIDGLTPDMIDRIEITRQASVTQDAAAAGGVVNIILKDPRAGQRGGVLKVGGGLSQESGQQDRRNQISLQLDGKGSSGEWQKLGYSLSANRMDNRVESRSELTRLGSTRTQDTHSQSTHAMLMPRLEYQPAAQQKWSVDGFLGQFDSQSRYSGSQGAGQQDSQTEPLRLNVRYEQGSEKDRKDTVRLSWSQEDETQDNSQGTVLHLREHSEETALGYSGSQRLGSTHQLKYGTDWRQTRIRNNVEADLNEDRQAVYLEENWQLAPRHTLTAGLRQERLQRSGLVQYQQDSSNPALAYRYQPTPAWSWQLGYNEASKAPRSDDLVPTVSVSPSSDAGSLNNPDTGGNPQLRPERIHALESTLGYNTADGGFNLTGFVRQIDDYIEKTVQLEQGRYVQRPANQSRAHTRGLELSARYALRQEGGHSWLLNGQLTTIRAEIDRPGGTRLASDVAPYSASLGLSYQYQPKRLSLSVNAGYTPAYTRPLDDQPYLRHVNARPSLDASLTQRFNDGWALTLSGRNLLAPDRQTWLEDRSTGLLVQSQRSDSVANWLLTVEKRF